MRNDRKSRGALLGVPLLALLLSGEAAAVFIPTWLPYGDSITVTATPIPVERIPISLGGTWHFRALPGVTPGFGLGGDLGGFPAPEIVNPSIDQYLAKTGWDIVAEDAAFRRCSNNFDDKRPSRRQPRWNQHDAAWPHGRGHPGEQRRPRLHVAGRDTRRLPNRKMRPERRPGLPPQRERDHLLPHVLGPRDERMDRVGFPDRKGRRSRQCRWASSPPRFSPDARRQTHRVLRAHQDEADPVHAAIAGGLLMPARRLLVASVLTSTLLLGAASAVGRADELPGVTEGGVFGLVIGDDGNVIVGLRHLIALTAEQIQNGDLNYQSQFVLWSGTKARTLDVDDDHEDEFPIAFSDIQSAPGRRDTFILRGVMHVDDSSHGAWVHQAYRLTGKGKLRKLWSIDTGRWVKVGDPPLEVSPDGTMWGVMVGRIWRPDADFRDRQLHFAFGSTRSSRIRRRDTLAFEREPRGEPEFLFLSSDGPLLLAPYADAIYLLRFTDSGVDAQRVDQLQPVRAAFGSTLFLVRWQSEERVLWGNDGKEWGAWDLWDLGASGFPDEPFLRFEQASGEPHPVRGFVRKTVAGSRYRVEHLWQSPRFSHLNERHVSDWRRGRPKPFSLAVSPNGRYGVVLEEVRETRDGKSELRQALRRFELAPAPPPIPPPGPATDDPIEP